MILVILLYFLSFLLILQFVGYPLLMAVIALREKPKKENYRYQPFVSIIVPIYNEEKVIEKRIKNLMGLDYPKDKYEIIIIESGSIDNTYNVAKEIVDYNPYSKISLRLLKEEERRGKMSAIYLGKKHAKADIIMITDANATFDKNVLKEMMPHFENPKNGAVSGGAFVSNSNGTITASESFFLDLEDIIKRGESHIDSACTFCGAISALRKELVNSDGEILAEDLDMAIHVRCSGYKIKYEPNAKSYEPSATTIKDQITQKKRTSIGTIQCIFKHWKYFLFPKDLYSLLIFPSHKTLVMFSPFLLLAIPILYIIKWDVKIAIIHFVLTVFIFVVLLALLMFLKSSFVKEKNVKSSFSIFATPKIVYYVLLNEYLILLAWIDFIFKKYTVLWEKAESTRQVFEK